MESASRLGMVSGHHRGTSRRRPELDVSQGTSSCPDPTSTGAEKQASSGNGDDPASDWTKAFLLVLLVLKAISWHHRRDTRAHAESVCPAIDIRGTGLCAPPCSSERRWKRQPTAGNNGTFTLERNIFRQPGPLCRTRSCACQGASGADADEDIMCLDDVVKLQCSGRRHGHVPPPPVPPPSEKMVDSPLTTTHLGNVHDISLAEEQRKTTNPNHTDSTTSTRAGQSMGLWHDIGDHMRNVPEFIDTRVQEPTEMQSDSTNASVGLQQPAADDQTRCVPWWSLPGFRFLPTDLEIVLHYLKHKVLDLELPEHNAVREGLDVYATNAEDITLDIRNGDKEHLGFFFVRKDHAYTNGCWYATPGGYWKVRRGGPAAIRHGGRVIAFRTSLDYVRGRAPRGRRTPWSMFVYALNARGHHDLRNLEQPSMNSFVVCKVRKRASSVIRVKKWPVSPWRYKLKKDLAPKAKVRRLVAGRVGGVRGVLGKRVIFRGTYWARFWSLRAAVEDRAMVKMACSQIEMIAMGIFANNGWRFIHRISQ
ncbi:hypothetical protein ACP70R_011364 [Stipagrostis hirtigluma subsp. patula]